MKGVGLEFAYTPHVLPRKLTIGRIYAKMNKG